MWDKSINKPIKKWLETTDNSSVVSNVVVETSSQILNILNLNKKNPLVKAVIEKMILNVTKAYSKNEKDKIVLIEFKIPDYSEVKEYWEIQNIGDFYKVVNYAVLYILNNLKIKPKWETEKNSNGEIKRIWYDDSEQKEWIYRRLIRFIFSDKFKYLRIYWLESVNEENSGINITTEYTNRSYIPEKNRDKKWELKKQSRYRFVNKDTKLLEIVEPKSWKIWMDVFWKDIKYRKNIEWWKNIKITKIPWTNKIAYYSNISWFIQYQEWINSNWIYELTSISIINEIEVTNLDFDINPLEENVSRDKDSILDINVLEDVIGGPIKFRWNLVVGKHIRTSTSVNWNVHAKCIMGKLNESIKVSASWNIDIESLSNANIFWSFVSLKNIDDVTWKTEKVTTNWNNTINTNCLEIHNLSLNWNLTINLWDKLFDIYNILLERIKNTKKEIKKDEENFIRAVEQMEVDINSNFKVVARKITSENLKELTNIFSAIRSLLYLEPFQIDKIMKFLDYIHNKHEFDFIWGYKIKFNRIYSIYENVKNNEKILLERENTLEIIKDKIWEMVIVIDWVLLASSNITLYNWDKSTTIVWAIWSKKEIISIGNESKKEKQIQIYKKYSLESGSFIDIERLEAEEMIRAAEEENRKVFTNKNNKNGS